ncbi:MULTISPECIES: RidA family protein [unclassified Marinobacter]|uniref:RidA family protein n=1 Tax=unclassified Marinobacter TaxID=83889 RepID=UPI00200E0190|nr:MULTISPECIES: RidA family protein [unclassified Marinobacter]UQG56504.1 RidA family protein [Marinobacter sp. M4C]UQG65308.1 RidA family protein [Marinobacter sp. M2C]UQG69587.1 RidA family protein [Marinobacter sp. M1C]
MTMLKLKSNERMSQIVVHNQTVYLSGQVGAVDEDVSAQTLTCLNKAKKLLEEVGSDKSKMLSATIWLKSMNDFTAMNKVWDQWFEGTLPPARACGESVLAHPDLLVEITIIAAE